MKGADAYVVRWRRTDSAQWENSFRVAGTAVGHVIPGIRVDDYVFGVSSVRDQFESPVASAVPGGAFAPYTPPPPAQP